MKFRFTLAASAVACGVISPVHARVEGQPIIPDWKQSRFEEANPAIRSVYVLAVCARVHRRDAIVAMLKTAPDSNEEEALIPTVIPSGKTECPIRVAGLTINSMTLVRGAVAEAIYNGDRMRPLADKPLPLTDAFERSVPNSTMAVARWTAKCAVRRTPRLTHGMLQFTPGAVGETRFLRSLKPVFTACLPAGERLQIPRIEMRALIAEQLYQATLLFGEAFTHA